MQEANEMRVRLIKEFSENYMEKLFYFCLKKTGNHAESEDLAQDIALQIITALEKGTIPTNFSAWVWQIARNRYSVWATEKHKRNESVTGSDIGDYEIEDESKNILDEMIHTEQLALLRRELAFIKSDYRDIVVAHYIEDRSIRDIALSLSISENTVKQRLYRARNILKEGMDMAREFSKRSYNPEEIVYTNVCTRPGELGQPWTLMDSKLNQNIFLACYDGPMTLEELAIEVGVAMPYMEDIVKQLTAQTMLSKNGDKYETNFPIISREAQRKIHYYYEGAMPRLTSMISENIDCLMAQFEEAGLCYYGKYQSYEEAKWALLMNFYKEFYSLCKTSPKERLGNTKRANKGVWDVVGFEKCDFTPESVGFHTQTNGFVSYRFEYSGICDRTPANLSEDETCILRNMVEGKDIEDVEIAERLVKYGFARKDGGKFVPNVALISQSVCKEFIKFCEQGKYSESFTKASDKRKKLNDSILTAIDDINRTVREIICADLPEFIRESGKTVDSLLGSICTTGHTLGYIIKHALLIGWLKYDESTTPAIGAYFNMP